MIMIIRLTYLASALSLAAGSKSAKTPGTPSPTDAATAKAGKSNPPIVSNEYFLAPFSCPQECISAHGYEAESHLLVDAVVECDVSDSYQKWKVHRVGSLLKFESAAQHDHDMCLAVVHQDPEHVSNLAGKPQVFADQGYDVWLGSPSADAPMFVMSEILNRAGYDVWIGSNELSGQIPDAVEDESGRRNLLSEDEVDGMCSEGKLGMAHCNHPGSYWYNTGGNLLSALCWDQGTPTAMSVDETCSDMRVLNTTMTGDLTTSETFMILGSN